MALAHDVEDGLAQRAQVLLLDEPSSALDPDSVHVLREMLGEVVARGGSVFLSSHDLPTVHSSVSSRGALRALWVLGAPQLRLNLARYAARTGLDLPNRSWLELLGEFYILLFWMF